MSGYKTYATALLMAGVVLARGLDWITPAQYEMLIGILGSLGLGFLRAGVEKSGVCK